MYYNPSCCIIFEHGTSFKSKKICKIWELIFKLLTVRQPFYFFKSKLFLVTLIIIDYHKFTYTLLIHILFLWGHVFLKDWESMVQELFVFIQILQKRLWSVNLFITERGNQIKRRLCSYRLWHAMKLLLIGRLNGEVNYLFVCLLVFNATFNNNSVISWRKPENHRKPSTCRKSLTNFIT